MELKLTSAGMVILDKEDNILILRCYKNWDMPKGRIEKGEDPLDAAKREVGEETGLTPKLISNEYFDCLYTLKKMRAEKAIRFFIAKSKTDEVELSNEHHEYRWVTAKEAKKILPDRFHDLIDWARKQI